MNTIPGLLRQVTAVEPNAPALVYEGKTWNFAALETLSKHAAGGLARLGVEKGDRVALWLPNSPAYIALWLGCARLGAVAVAVNTRFRATEVGDIVHRSGARVLAMWPDFRAIAFLDILAEIDPGALERLDTLILYSERGESPDIPNALKHTNQIPYEKLIAGPRHESDFSHAALPCNMFTTSGTTKAPKFVVHTHASVTRHAQTVAAADNYAASSGGILQTLPLCGVFGFCQATAALAGGRPMLLMSAFDPEQALNLIDEYSVEYLNGTDDMLTALFDATTREIALPSVKHSGFASFAAEPTAFMDLAESRGLTLVGLYGMSEVQAFFARQPLHAPPERRLLGGGLPLDPQATVRVTDPETRALLPPGEEGEIELGGPSSMKEYYANPEATAETVTSDGYVRSGDLGTSTDDGGFIYLARMGDVLRLGGFLVAPAEIEAHLNTHPLVTGAQVVGIPTERGTRPIGFVTVAPGADRAEDAEESLRSHCLAGLAKFKMPDHIYTVAEFPTTKSANGTKIQKARLREMAIQASAQKPPQQ